MTQETEGSLPVVVPFTHDGRRQRRADDRRRGTSSTRAMEAMGRRARANEEEHRRRCEYAEVRAGGADGRGGAVDARVRGVSRDGRLDGLNERVIVFIASD